MSSVSGQFQRPITTNVSYSFQDVDQTIPYRFVGSYEYYNAMLSFSKLLEISTPDEIEVYTIILNDRPEFTYFNGHNTAFPSKPDLAKADPFERKKYFDDFQKKGLAAMVALARVELAATMSMYGESEKPFSDIVTNQFGWEEYIEVLADDVVAHMKSLAKEKKFEAVTTRSYRIDTWTLAYLRRLKLMRDMLTTLGDVGNADMKARIRPYDQELAKYEKRLLSNVARQTQTQSTTITDSYTRSSSSTSTRVSNQVIRNCDNVVSRSTSRPTKPRSKKKVSLGDAVLAR